MVHLWEAKIVVSNSVKQQDTPETSQQNEPDNYEYFEIKQVGVSEQEYMARTQTHWILNEQSVHTVEILEVEEIV